LIINGLGYILGDFFINSSGHPTDKTESWQVYKIKSIILATDHDQLFLVEGESDGGDEVEDDHKKQFGKLGPGVDFVKPF
jgi:hypothetical protein